VCQAHQHHTALQHHRANQCTVTAISRYAGLVDDSIAYREANAPHLPNIDFVTEFPKLRNMKKGQPLGEC
jgi:hypothetical protein